MTPVPFEIRQPDFQTFLFDQGVPEAFLGDGDSKLSISDRVYRGDTRSSLRWDWSEPGAVLSFQDSEAFKHLTGENAGTITYEWVTFCNLSAFSLWVFNEAARPETLWFEIGDREKADVRFPMSLNFAGWRRLQFFYGRDLTGFPNQETADTLRIIAPGCSSGTLYFSHFSPRKEVDSRMAGPTAEAPWVGVKGDRRVLASPYSGTRESRDAGKAAFPLLPELSPEQVAELQAISAGFFSPYAMPPAPQKVTMEQTRELRATIVKATGLRREGDFVSGGISGIAEFYRLVGVVAEAFVCSWGVPQADEGVSGALSELFLEMMDLVIQHGHLSFYGMRSHFIRPVWLMREELKAAGKFRPLLDRLRTIAMVDELYDEAPFGNADVYNTLLEAQVACLLLEDETPGKWRDMVAFQRWMEITSHHGEIQPDGSLFHHSMIYTGYGFPAIGPVCRIVRMLHGTSFATPQMHVAARRVAAVMHFFSCAAEAPHFFSGRWRRNEPILWPMAKMYVQLAECGNPATGEALDREMASIYLYYARLFGQTDVEVRRFAGQGIAPAKPEGHLSLNSAITAIHRRDSWMAAVRGQRSGIFANEIYAYQAGNTLGRFLNYGHLVIHSKGSPVSAKASGFDPNHGWNWCLWPGTTSRLLPAEALRSHFELEESITSEPFAGGACLGQDGVFGMKLQEELPGLIDPLRLGPPMEWLGEKEYKRRVVESCYDPGFRARKSWFFFQDRIVCLGSGIVSTDGEHETVTTLFQNALDESGKLRFLLNSEAPAFPVERRLQSNDVAVWIIDSCDNGYYLPAGNNPLLLTRRFEKWPYHSHWNEAHTGKHQEVTANEGDIEFAILEHGKAPQGAGYEYCVVIDSSPEQMATFANGMRREETAPYQVLQRNDTAHIVYDAASKTTGYVFFEASCPASVGVVVSVSAACVVMVRPSGLEQGIEALQISVFTPPHEGPVYVSAPVSVVLRGSWSFSGSRSLPIRLVEERPGETTLQIECAEQPLQMKLSGAYKGCKAF